MSIFTTFVSLTRLTATLAAGTFLLAAADGASAEDGGVEVPATLNSNKLAGSSRDRTHSYSSCRTSPAGKHYAGPTWEGLDGGKVVGEVKTSMQAPVDKAIPWLLLDAKSHEGSGAFTQAKAIVRLGTTGGIATGDGCDQARAGYPDFTN